MTKVELSTGGMHCASCSALITKAFAKTPRIRNAKACGVGEIHCSAKHPDMLRDFKKHAAQFEARIEETEPGAI
ncbi:cation transporter [Candidatus Micrarchaeota archaeon]|nr:cation transporter [Candidatus Micrarchaeota archaeon]